MKAEKIYINVDLQNTNSQNFTALTYDEAKDIPIIKTQSRNPVDSSWEIAVLRWSVKSSAIPILFFDNNAYKITITSPAVPNPPPTNVQYLQTFQAPNAQPPYNRAVYDYTTLIQFINSALRTAFVAAGGLANVAPFFKFYPTTQLINLILPQEPTAGESWYSQADPNGWKIYFNYELFDWFVSLPATYLKINPPNIPIQDYKDYIIICDSLNGTNEYAAGDLFPSLAYPTLVIEEEYPTISRIQDIQKVVFTTNKIPIFSESVPSLTQDGKAKFLNAITDFELDNSFFDKSTISFNGGAEPRWLSLLQDTEIRSIDIQGYWQSKDGSLYPIFLAPKCDYFNMKLCLRRKWQPRRVIVENK